MPRKRRRTKKGTPYEIVVAEVHQAMDPGANVSRGVWVQGPDGRRELDVRIIGSYKGEERKVLIECKDYNPRSTGPVGIETVDALESKIRDLSFHFSAICSNAGFTEGAIKKASRVGIGLISIMKKGDKRVRFSVSEEIYTRKVHINELRTSLLDPKRISPGDTTIEEVTFEGIPIANWIAQRVMLLISANPIVAGSFTAKHPFNVELEFKMPSRAIRVKQLDFNFSISGGWFAQQVTLDATQGIYDWLRHRVHLAPGPSKFLINGVDLQAGDPINKPPERMLKQISPRQPGELEARLLLITGLPINKPVPQLDKYISQEDLEFVIPKLPPEAYTSVST